jgi:cytochrome c peroxidase
MKNITTLSLLAVMMLSACGGNEEQKKKEQEAAQSAEYDALLKEKGIADLFSPIPASSVGLEDPKVNLGYHLYYDTRLSKKGTISCNSCHNLSTFGVDKEATSPGDDGIRGDRNSPTVINASMHFKQFWDGRAETIEEQAGMPVLNPVEMNIPDKAFLVSRLSDVDLYKDLFAKAYPGSANPINYDNIQNAIGAFERTLVTPSRFDDYLKGNKEALTLAEKKGMMSFITTGCTQCHTGPLLGGNIFQKFGVHEDYWKYTKSQKVDEGLFAISKNENEKYMFKVPSMRNIEHTGPYFHDGSVTSLEESVKIMAKVQLNYNISDAEVNNIVAFLKALSADVPESVKKAPAALAAK